MLYLSKDVPKIRSVGMYRCGGPYLADTIEDARVEAWKNRKATGKCCINKIVAYEFDNGRIHTLPVEMVQSYKGGAYTERGNESILYEFDKNSGELTGRVVFR